MQEIKQIGKYSIVASVNMGGMAEVFKARDPGNNVCAIKFILPEYSQNQSFIQMLVREATVTSTLRHPNVLRLFDTGFDRATNRYYLAMEFIHGKNLWEIIAKLIKAKKRIPIETLIRLMSKLLAGLYYAHDYKTYFGENINLVHQDVNPPNVMIGFDGKVKLADFGIAKAKNLAYKKSDGEKDAIKGKFSYMSPEQAAGKPIDHQTDLYAVGIMLWELLTLTKLYIYKDADEALKKVSKGKIPKPSIINPDIPTKLERIVMKALERSKKARYQTCAEFNYDLLCYLDSAFPKRPGFGVKNLMATLWPEESPFANGSEPIELLDEREDKPKRIQKVHGAPQQ